MRVDRMALGGDAVGHFLDSGQRKVVFVPYAAPGDHAVICLEREKKTYCRARVVGLKQASNLRVRPPCPYFFQGDPNPSTRLRAGKKWCGGCDWQHLNYTSQLESKKQILIETLERIGKLQDPPVDDLLMGREPWRYREKVQVPFREVDGRPAFGFYAPGSHEVVEFEDCLVQPRICTDILKSLKHEARQNRWPPYDEDRGSGWLRHVILRVNQSSEMLVTLVTRTPTFPGSREFCESLRSTHPNVVGIHQNVNPDRTNRILGRDWKKLWGSDALFYDVGFLRLQVSPASFFQVNETAAHVLCQTVERFLGGGGSDRAGHHGVVGEEVVEAERRKPGEGETRWDVLLDLYCGVGLFGLFLAGKARQIIGLDEVPHAIRDAFENQKRNHVPHAHFEVASLERGLPVLLMERLRGLRVAAIVDPPRAGLAPRLLQTLQTLGPDPLIYVSCDPATLARDLEGLCHGRYALCKVQPLDLFPQTSHIESVAFLRRRNA